MYEQKSSESCLDFFFIVSSLYASYVHLVNINCEKVTAKRIYFDFPGQSFQNHIKCIVFKLHVKSRQLTFKCSTVVREKSVVVSCAGSNTFAHAASHKYSA